jgi:PAS domain S-box-containing protein
MMVTQIGLDGRWLKVPPLLCRLLGYEEAELLALRIQDVLHPDDAECDWWQYQRILVSDIKSFSTEKRFVARNGRQLWLDASVSLVTDDRNQPERFLTYLRDITEHKQAEDRIRMQAESLDLAHDAIVVLDLSGRILSWNGGAHRLFGRSPEETIGQEFIRLLSEKETGQMRACLEQTPRTGLCNRHLEKLTRAGAKLEVQSSWCLLKSEGGGPKAFLIVETESGQTMPD